jgi:hypothetical protein
MTIKFKLILLILTVGAIALLAVPWSYLWVVKYQALTNYRSGDAKYRQMLESTLLHQVLIHSTTYEGERVSANSGGYRYSFPSDGYEILPSLDYAGKPMPKILTFATAKLKIICWRTFSLAALTGEKAPEGPLKEYYFKKIDPYQLEVDAFNCTPETLKSQTTLLDVTKCGALFETKVMLWRTQPSAEFKTAELKGIMSGIGNKKGVTADVYLPDTQSFAPVTFQMKPGFQTDMDEINRALGDLRIEKARDEGPTSSSSN